MVLAICRYAGRGLIRDFRNLWARRHGTGRGLTDGKHAPDQLLANLLYSLPRTVQEVPQETAARPVAAVGRTIRSTGVGTITGTIGTRPTG